MSLHHKTAAPEMTGAKPPTDIGPAEFLAALFNDPVMIERPLLLRKPSRDGKMEDVVDNYVFKILSTLEEGACRQRAVRRTEAEWRETLKEHVHSQLIHGTYEEALSANVAAEVLAEVVYHGEKGHEKRVFYNAEMVLRAARHNVEILSKYYYATVVACSPTIDIHTQELEDEWYEWIMAGMDTSFFLVLLDKPRLVLPQFARFKLEIEKRDSLIKQLEEQLRDKSQ